VKKLVAVDVDLTVVDSLSAWYKWLSVFSDEPVLNESKSYNLYPEIRGILDRAGHPDVDPLDFWRMDDLYDTLKPVEGSVEALKQVYDSGDILLFVSSCFPEHEKSKVNLLNKYFPFMDAFISTHDKHFVAYDVLVDDKLEHMRLGHIHRPQAQHILFTGVRADGTIEDRFPYKQMSKWSHFDFILNPMHRVGFA
jgi:5'(3')-deoxyribonucleotidase